MIHTTPPTLFSRPTLPDLINLRMWVVRNLLVFGTKPDIPFYYFAGDWDPYKPPYYPGTWRLYFSYIDPFNQTQPIAYQTLVDHRGYHLPSKINGPVIYVQSQSEYHAWPCNVDDNHFIIQRDPESPHPIAVDLFIIESLKHDPESFQQ